MSFVKPELHHRRSFSRRSEKRGRKRKASTDESESTVLPDTPSPSILQALPAATSDSALPSSSGSPTRSPIPRRQSQIGSENDDTPNKRRKKDPEFWWEVTHDTTVLKPPPSSSGEISKSKGWATTTSSSSDEDIGEDFQATMEDISMDYLLASEVEKREIHDGIAVAVDQEHILPIQGEALKELFNTSYDQKHLYAVWQQDDTETPDEDEGLEIEKPKAEQNEEVEGETEAENGQPEKEEEEEEEGRERPKRQRRENSEGEETEHTAEKKKSNDGSVGPEQEQDPQPTKSTTKCLSIPKLKDALVTLRAGVGKFSLRIKEAQDKKIIPDTEIKPKRSSTYRAMLMHRDLNRCVITHARDSLIAAHILPFTIASLARSHRFWSLLRLMLGPKICDQLFERYGYRTTRHHQGNKGINSPENGWILRYDLDGAFARMECYLEPIPEEPHKYTFKWLQGPKERIRMSVYHSDEKRQDELLKSGEVIDLTPVETPESQNIPNQSTARVVPPPSRALLQMQAAIHKLANKFRGQADIFNTRSHPDWDSDSVSSIEDDYEARARARRYELEQAISAEIHIVEEECQVSQDILAQAASVCQKMYTDEHEIVKWLRDISPERPDKAGLKRKRSDIEDEQKEVEVPTPPATPRKRGHAAAVAVGGATMPESGKARTSNGSAGPRKRKRT
ncbi:hypothetical protein TWF730_007429 [Orbilia blumenaviensis]|uniref:HNH nuclease domain-containing protein n=1 Tax=Orbilia blumenaviensis TaxID=1796055 RepID=A0AAV9V8D2_9PEZI